MLKRNDLVEVLPEFRDEDEHGWIGVVVKDENEGDIFIHISLIDMSHATQPILLFKANQLNKVEL